MKELMKIYKLINFITTIYTVIQMFECILALFI